MLSTAAFVATLVDGEVFPSSGSGEGIRAPWLTKTESEKFGECGERRENQGTRS